MMQDDFEWELAGAVRAALLARYITEVPSDEVGVRDVFRLGHVAGCVNSVRSTINGARQLAEESGVLLVVEDYFAEIVDGLDPQMLPAEDRALLRSMGSHDPDGDLALMMHLLRARKAELAAATKEVPLRQQLRNLDAHLDQMATRLTKAEPSGNEVTPQWKGPGRRWFKGLGQIAQGAGLALLNVVMACGGIAGLSPDTQTVGAIASAATGFGTIMIGIGDLRNE